ncbi:hypothetical protein GW17_00019240, partial [Ensete ventricosum]
PAAVPVPRLRHRNTRYRDPSQGSVACDPPDRSLRFTWQEYTGGNRRTQCRYGANQGEAYL